MRFSPIPRMHRLVRHVRALFRLEPGKPALWAGLRAALATTLPLAVAFLLGVPQAGWAGLTGLLVTLADRGGSYRSRAKVMGTVTVLGAVVGALAAPLGGRPWMDALLLLLGVTAASFMRCYGEVEGGVGGQLAVIFVASLGAHEVGLEAAAARGGALLLGGLWAMAQALVLWPLRPYRPVRKDIARVYHALADVAEELALRAREAATHEVWTVTTARHTQVQRPIEEARATLAATRLGRPGESRRGEHLLVLLELTEPMLGVLFALTQAMEVASHQVHLQPERERVARLCEAYAAMARWVAQALVSQRNVGRVSAPGKRLPVCSAAPPAPPTIRPRESLQSASIAELLARLREYSGLAHETAAGLLHGDPISQLGWPVVEPRESRARSLLGPLRDHLDPHSFVLRHSLRAGLVASAALLLTHALGLGQAHWVVLSAIGILQPYSASTEERALQRVVGTLLGASLAAAIATTLNSPWAVLAVIAVLTATSVSILPLNFGAFQVLLTPDYLLLVTLHYGDWTVAGSRALGVLLACALALAGAWLLWPSPERRRFPDAAAAALRADGDYLRQVAASRSSSAMEVGAARRNLGLALLEAEASFQRLLAEFHGPPQQLEPGMAVLTYSRCLAAAVTALGEQRAETHASRVLPELAQGASGALDVLADSLREGRPPPPLPSLPEPQPADDPVSCALLERVPRQLDMLHGAVTRLSVEPALR